MIALSAINADEDFSRQPSRFRGDRNKEVEQLAVDSGLEWVSLRPRLVRHELRRDVGYPNPERRRGRWPYAESSSAPIVESSGMRANAELFSRSFAITLW